MSAISESGHCQRLIAVNPSARAATQRLVEGVDDLALQQLLQRRGRGIQEEVVDLARCAGRKVEVAPVQYASEDQLAAVAKGHIANANASLGAADASARISAAQMSLAATIESARMQIAAMASAAGISANTTNYSKNESISESSSTSCNKSVSRNDSCISSSSSRQDFNAAQISIAETMGAYWTNGPNIGPSDLSGGSCDCG